MGGSEPRNAPLLLSAFPDHNRGARDFFHLGSEGGSRFHSQSMSDQHSPERVSLQFSVWLNHSRIEVEQRLAQGFRMR